MKHIVYKIKEAGTKSDFMHHDKQTFSEDVFKQKVYTSEDSVDKVAEEFDSKGIEVEVKEFYLIERDEEAEYKQLQETAAASLIPELRNTDNVELTLKEAAELLRDELIKIDFYDRGKKLNTKLSYFYNEDEDYEYDDEYTFYHVTFCEGEDEGEPVGECLVEAVPFIEDNKLMMHCITYSNIKAIDRKGRENRDAFYAIEIDIESYIRLRDQKIKLNELLNDEEFMNS